MRAAVFEPAMLSLGTGRPRANDLIDFIYFLFINNRFTLLLSMIKTP